METKENNNKEVKKISVQSNAIVLLIVAAICLCGSLAKVLSGASQSEQYRDKIQAGETKEILEYGNILSVYCNGNSRDKLQYNGSLDGEGFSCVVEIDKDLYLDNISFKYEIIGANDIKIKAGDFPYTDFEVDDNEVIVRRKTELEEKGQYINWNSNKGVVKISGIANGTETIIRIFDILVDTHGHNLSADESGIYDPESANDIEKDLTASQYAYRIDGDKYLFYKKINNQYELINTYKHEDDLCGDADLENGKIRIGNNWLETCRQIDFETLTEEEV